MRRQVAIAALVLAWSMPAGADSLDDAKKALESSDYMTAKTALEAALKGGKSDPSDLAEIYKLTGIVEGALDNTAVAQTAFERFLSLSPKGSLPQGTSPRIQRPFDAAKEKAKKAGAVQAKTEIVEEPPAITLIVVNDPQKLIVGAKVYFTVDRSKNEQLLEADGTDKITIDLVLAKRIDLRVHAVDQYGNRVVELGSKDVPIVITSSGEEKKIDPGDVDLLRTKQVVYDTPRPLYLQWWLWGGVTVVATGVGGYFAWQTRSDIQAINHNNRESLSHVWGDTQVIQERAERNLLVANIAGGVAGAFAIGTVLLYLTRPTNFESNARTTTTVTAVPKQGGAAIVLGGHF